MVEHDSCVLKTKCCTFGQFCSPTLPASFGRYNKKLLIPYREIFRKKFVDLVRLTDLVISISKLTTSKLSCDQL